MAVKLIIDSASDISLKQANEMGIQILPMTVTIDGKEYRSCFDLSAKQFYEKLIETDSIPVTSLVPPSAFEEAFRQAVENGDTPIAVTVSSKLSGTYQSACIAAESFSEKVFVVDSLNVSLGQAILIQHAHELIFRGSSASNIVEELEKVKTRITVLALLNTLEYLKKGGRISSATATLGGVLSIKPVISVIDGEIKLVGKARGSKNGNNLLAEIIRKGNGIDFSMPLSLAYSGLSDAILQKYIEDSKSLWEEHIDSLPILEIGPVVGTHSGPGAIAVAFFEKCDR